MPLIVKRERESATLTSLDIPYWIKDPDVLPGSMSDRDEAVAAASIAAQTEIGSEPDDYSATRLSHAVHRVVIQYRASELRPLTPLGHPTPSGPVITSEAGFNSTPWEPVLLERSIETVAVFNAADGSAATIGPGPFEAPDHRGGIHVPYSHTGRGWPRGVELRAPPETDYINIVIPNGSFTSAYRTTVESLLWKVNDDTFQDKPAGSVMLVRASARRNTDDTMHLAFGFSHRPNRPRTIGGVTTAASVDGHDYVWDYCPPRMEQEDGQIAAVFAVTFFYVERVWPRADLNLLALPE